MKENSLSQVEREYGFKLGFTGFGQKCPHCTEPKYFPATGIYSSTQISKRVSFKMSLNDQRFGIQNRRYPSSYIANGWENNGVFA